jgi:hypothetical protein
MGFSALVPQKLAKASEATCTPALKGRARVAEAVLDKMPLHNMQTCEVFSARGCPLRKTMQAKDAR